MEMQKQINAATEEIITPLQSISLISKALELGQEKGIFMLKDAFHLYCSYEILLEYIQNEQERAIQNEKLRQVAEIKAQAIEHEYKLFRAKTEEEIEKLKLNIVEEPLQLVEDITQSQITIPEESRVILKYKSKPKVKSKSTSKKYK